MSYEIFAAWYDAFTINADYDRRAEYICALLKQAGVSGGTLLDLACGTGSLMYRLCEKGFDLIGVDRSQEMLSLAQSKLFDNDCHALLLCQDMTQLDLYDTVDAAICSLDSLNHLTDEKKLRLAFEKVSLFMNPGGIFIFDMNTVYKHREVLADNAFVLENEKAFCVWQNEALPGDIVNITLDFFVKSGNKYERFSENFKEKAYESELICEIVKSSGFELLNMYNELTFDPPHKKSERVFYLARKK